MAVYTGPSINVADLITQLQVAVGNAGRAGVDNPGVYVDIVGEHFRITEVEWSPAEGDDDEDNVRNGEGRILLYSPEPLGGSCVRSSR